MDKRGGCLYDSPLGNFWSHFTEKLRRGPFPARQYFNYPKKICMTWYITIFCGTSSASQSPKFSWVNPSVSEKFILVWKKIRDKKGISQFRRNFFSLPVPKKIVGHPSGFPKVWGCEKLYA